MIALLQRVRRAAVEVDAQPVGAIGAGLLVLLGVEALDNQVSMQKLADKVLKYRLFNDENGKMNLNVQQAGGALLVVSQFTLAADTNSGFKTQFYASGLASTSRAVISGFCRLLPCPRHQG